MDGTKDIHRALAHGWMDFGPDIYGECRDIEQERSGCEMSAWVIAGQSHAWTGRKTYTGAGPGVKESLNEPVLTGI